MGLAVDIEIGHPSLFSETKNHDHLVSQNTQRILDNWSCKQGQR